MALECSVCRDLYRKLKRLKCRHAFCDHCLGKIAFQGKIRCPYCRQETNLPTFGVADLISQFDGQIECTDCARNVEFHDSSWCSVCESILCMPCTERGCHEEHMGAVEPVDKSLAPVTYCVQQLDKLSAIHTRLTMMQKQLINQYVKQLGDAFQRELDDDLAVRLRRLKAEKQYLRQAFDLNASSHSVSSSSLSGMNHANSIEDAPISTAQLFSIGQQQASTKNREKAANSGHFASVLKEVYKMSPVSLQNRASTGFLPKKGIIFNPPAIEKMVDLCLENGRFAAFSTSYNALRKNHTRQIPVNYYGSGILDDPCDLCIIPERQILLVACVSAGIFSFKMTNGSDAADDDDYDYENVDATENTGRNFRHYAPTTPSDQFAGISYDAENRFIVTTVLRNYRQWIVQIYERRGMKLRAETLCPNEPKVQNSWYRWVTCVARGHALVCTGDRNTSVIWLLNLHNHRWKTLLLRQNAAFRKPAFHQPTSTIKQEEGLLYVPDMRNKSVATFLLNTKSWELSKANEIKTAEFVRELPITVNAKSGKLMVGYWNTGNVIYADLYKSSSFTLTSVGPKEIFNSCFLDTTSILVLCKQKEVVELYTL